jgi:hypothetical protein
VTIIGILLDLRCQQVVSNTPRQPGDIHYDSL